MKAMKLLSKALHILILAICFSTTAKADGWPANYNGVMLQAFYWDSYTDTKWTNLTSQADELSAYFDLIWVPQSGNCNSSYNMGYTPVWWFNHNGSFGTESELRTMISTFNAKGTGIIEDVALNHRSGNTSWVDFPTETWNGHTLKWYMTDICSSDEYFSNPDTQADREYWGALMGGTTGGAADERDDFDGSRDLNHQSSNVQQNIKWYLDFLLNDLGYAGFRLDMVKGYPGYYTGMYNDAVNPQFCVGEYFDGSYDAVVNWMKDTGIYNGEYGNPIRSAAFDFPLKYSIINAAFENGNFSEGAFSNKGIAGDGASGMNRYAVTFIDNHDTFRDNSKLNYNILAANAFILALPGTPCIFLKHWQAYKDELKKMIDARKDAGITNQSAIVEEGYNGNAYYMKVQGTRKKIMFVAGFYNDLNTSGFKMISCGTVDNPNYAFYEEDIDIDESVKDITIYCSAASAPYLYVWDGNGTNLNGSWPGTKMTEYVTGVDGTKWWKKTFTDQTVISAIFNTGNNGSQTADLTNISSDIYFFYDGSTYATNMTSYHQNEDKAYYCYVEIPSACNWGSDIYAWAWGSSGNLYSSWPGSKDDLNFCGLSSTGGRIFKWTSDTAVTGIIFNDGSKQSVDLTFANGAYYKLSTTTSSGKYTLASQTSVPSNTTIFDRTFTASYRSTVCLPFDLTEKDILETGGNFYEFSNEEDGVLYFTSVTSTDAFKPYIFVSGTTKKCLASFTGKLIQSGSAQNVTKGNFTFVGSTTESLLKSNATTTYYGYSNGSFVKVGTNGGATISPYRAYFQTATSNARAPQNLVLDGQTTDITSIQTSTQPQQTGIYTLSGVRMNTELNQLPKGIYIVNGRKLVIR